MNDDLVRALTATADGSTVRLERSYRHDPADVWSAWTEPDRLRRWFGEVGGDLRVGGTAWMWSADPSEGGGRATIDRCEPPSLLEVTWTEGEGPASHVQLHLSTGPGGVGTHLELVHRGPTGFDDIEYGAGWEAFLVAVDEHLATGGGDTDDPRWRPFELSLRPTWAALAR